MSFLPYTNTCSECGAVIADTPNGQYRALHEEWHKNINNRINAAAQVGAHADMMTKPLGG